MNKVRNIARNLLLLMVPLTMLLFYNHVANWHYHILGNGIVVKHAHPYNQSEKPGNPYSNHKHTDLEFFVLGQLFTSVLILALLFAFLIISVSLDSVSALSTKRPPYISQIFLKLQLLRAPPAWLII